MTIKKAIAKKCTVCGKTLHNGTRPNKSGLCEYHNKQYQIEVAKEKKNNSRRTKTLKSNFEDGKERSLDAVKFQKNKSAETFCLSKRIRDIDWVSNVSSKRGNFIHIAHVRTFIHRLMQDLEKQIINGNKLNFTDTIVTIKMRAGKDLL